MKGKSWWISIGVVAMVALGAYLGHNSGEADTDKVEATAKAVADLLGAVWSKVPRASISEYKVITEDLAKGGSIPKAFMSAAGVKNAWGGNVVVQVFPPNAWKPGIAETVNVVLETLPEADCARMVQKLSRQSPESIFQINVEPSKKLHTTFPVRGDTGCSSSLNNIGYTVLAK